MLSEVFERKKIRWKKLNDIREKSNEKKKAVISAHRRISMICDNGEFKELDANLESNNPIDFPDYDEKRKDISSKCHIRDAFVSAIGKIDGRKALIGAFDTRFLMGSMGTVVGEKIARLASKANKDKLPLIIFSASGGARMQEGLFSLMQMAKTSAAITRFKDNGGLFISVLTNPTTGGVSASFASLGDIIIAEPNALICFAGPRVIKQTIGEELPEGFQRSEFLLEHGMIDMIVPKEEMKDTLSKLLKLHSGKYVFE